MKKRIDSLFSKCQILSRTEFQKAVKRREITCNGEIVKSPSQKVEEGDIITYKGQVVEFNEFVYIMLNKPSGVVSASEDRECKTVIDILPTNLQRKGLFPCGRLDKDTTGLVIITNDGVSSHKRLSPKHHAKKVYYFECAEKVTDIVKSEIESGVLLKDGYTTKPCELNLITATSGEITLTEGKYHEIKRIFGAKNNKITLLKRISFAGIKLDDSLASGECRLLTEEEVKLFTE